ncbi:MAG: DUF760 domain-containing protein [Cyanobacteriota bacterium]|nr:DUF760 domain-containing protein [Cyanobacteriota bacterium]
MANKEPRKNSDFWGESDSVNQLWQYVQNLSPEAIAQLSKPQSSEVLNVMERNILGLLGTLPPEHFDVQIGTNREHLGRLLASAIMSGYFLRNAEQRMYLEQSWQQVGRQATDFE